MMSRECKNDKPRAISGNRGPETDPPLWQCTNCNLLTWGFFATYSRTLGSKKLGNSKEGDDIGMRDALPHRNLLAKNLVANYLPGLLYVVSLVDTESFNRNPLAVVNAFPNIAGTPVGDRTLIRSDEFIGYDMRIREQPGSTTKLAELLKYLCIVLWDRKSLFRIAMVRMNSTEQHIFLG